MPAPKPREELPNDCLGMEQARSADTAGLCSDCHMKLKIAFATIDFYQKLATDGSLTGDLGWDDQRLYFEQELPVGGSRNARQLFDSFRMLKDRDWTGNYCVLCVRLCIEFKRSSLAKRNRCDAEDSDLVIWKLQVYGIETPASGVISFEVRGPNLMYADEVLLLGPREPVADLASLMYQPGSSLPFLTPSSAFDDCLLKPREGLVPNPNLIKHYQGHQVCNRCDLNLFSKNDHSICHVSSQKPPTWLPDRLLQISDSGDSVTLLRTTVDMCKVGSDYVTLSHRWGKPSHRLLLTTQTEAAFSAGTPITALAKTFRHTIHLAHGLGYKYIWIDSLCILQDSAIDWLAQSAVMGKVYANGSFNIAAVEAADDEEGILPITDPRVARGFAIQTCGSTQGSNAHTETTKIALWTNEFFGCTCAHYEEARRFGLIRRGWVWQERELAERTLLVDDLQVTWTCQRQRHPAWPRTYDGDLDMTWTDWTQMVRSYTETELTFATDRLVAISAIAERISQRNGWRYYAGLFEPHFVSQLAWIVQAYSSGTVVSASIGYLAPSWSWASVGTAVTYGAKMVNRTDLANFVSIDIDLVDEGSPFGKVKGGSASLLCEILPVRNLAAGSDDRYAETDEWGLLAIEVQNTQLLLQPDTELTHSRLHLADLDVEILAIPLIITQEEQFPRYLVFKLMIVERLPGLNIFRRLGLCSPYFGYNGDCEDHLGFWYLLDDLSTEFRIKHLPLMHELKENSEFWTDLAHEVRERLQVKGRTITII